MIAIGGATGAGLFVGSGANGVPDCCGFCLRALVDAVAGTLCPA
jgi:hypothetical protein